MLNFDLNKTLEELEGEAWGEPEFTSNLVLRCHELRRKPLKEFSVEDLRIMIGQNFSLAYLVPFALSLLAHTPFVGGDFYKGDLLVVTLRIGQDFWNANPELYYELDLIVTDVKSTIDTLFPLVNSFKKPY
ncbi:contact-dependent growth inhibition system immunity protein [Paenibacillus polymyxa]|uniref:contact-dependent growth inhibition system immunity protein n=1 Tax=Paenibacillus polymyxa TaxID=1406 RepID=UPI0023780128|nr:contact-dependent growth inhibition system immunity protein [Paenibacillus polymyxa]WDM21278.1 hypothetical protein J4I02_20270 [Paenibacillus polymyxa]